MGLSKTPRLAVSQYWLKVPQSVIGYYKPAIWLECQLKFHNLRAQIKHSEEKHFIAWYTKDQSVINWDITAVNIENTQQISLYPTCEIPYDAEYDFTPELLQSAYNALLEKLVRTEHLRIFYNSHFDIFSEPGETRIQFISRLSEDIFRNMEDELAQIVRRVNLKIAQIREAQERRGRRLEFTDTHISDVFLSINSELLVSRERLEALFSSGERLLVSSIDRTQPHPGDDPEYIDILETLKHIEDETKRELNELCTRAMQKASECDPFDIGLQLNQIQVLREGVLWIPTNNPD